MSDLIDGYVDALKAAGRSPATIADRTKLLHRLSREVASDLNASPAELARWFGRYRGWTLYTYWQNLFGFYVWATAGREPIMEWNPMAGLMRPRAPRQEPHPATDEQVGRALAALRDPWRRAVLIAAAQGLRCAEMCRLDREHVDERHIWVDRKGGKTQLLPIHPAVWADLAGLPPGPVLRTRGGARFGPNHLTNAVSHALTRAGLPELTLHRFRASFATRLADEGRHITVIQDLMGHAQITTTQGYIRVRDEQRRLAISTLPVPTASPLQSAA